MNLFANLYLLQRIDHLVRTRATGSPQRLAERLQISERHVYRLISDLREQGFPIVYNNQDETYCYSEPVKIEFSILVGDENLMHIRGGEKKRDNFYRLPNYGSLDSDFCDAF